MGEREGKEGLCPPNLLRFMVCGKFPDSVLETLWKMLYEFDLANFNYTFVCIE